MCSAGSACIGNGNSQPDCNVESNNAQECCSCTCAIPADKNSPRCTGPQGAGGAVCLARRFPNGFMKPADQKAGKKDMKESKAKAPAK